MRLSWFENAYSHPAFSAGVLICKVGQTDLVSGERPGFVSRSVHAMQDYKSLCADVLLGIDKGTDFVLLKCVPAINRFHSKTFVDD